MADVTPSAEVPAEVLESIERLTGKPIRLVNSDQGIILAGFTAGGRKVVVGPSGPGWRVDVWRPEEDRVSPMVLASVKDPGCGVEYVPAMVNLALEQADLTLKVK